MFPYSELVFIVHDGISSSVNSPAAAMADLVWFWCAAACVKVLLAPSYRSTDFEVHRHWLALTSSLPISQWYVDASSPWTLDYPPLFAYFEFLLSIPAAIVDPGIVDIRNLGYDAESVVVFQRLSVVFADLSLFVGAGLIARRLSGGKRRLVYALILWSPALIIVDHVHFQYNGLLLGVLLLSLALLSEGRDLEGGLAFAVLICSKHLFAVAAPVYFVYLLRHYCSGRGIWRDLGRFLKMGAVVGVVAAVSFGPFLYHGQVMSERPFALCVNIFLPFIFGRFQLNCSHNMLHLHCGIRYIKRLYSYPFSFIYFTFIKTSDRAICCSNFLTTSNILCFSHHQKWI